MASKPENIFRASVHKYLPKTLHHEKMSNPYRSGGADDWYSGSKGDLWIEYKFIKALPARSTTRIVPNLSPLQIEWCRDRFEEGRTVRVIVGCPTGGVIFNSPSDWEAGVTTGEFKGRLVARQELAKTIMAFTVE